MATDFSRDEFVTFLLEAKRRTYAAGTGEAAATPALSGSHQLEYQSGDWLYRDIYFGGAFFVGQETVYHRGAPVWAMAYAGGVTSPAVTPDQVGAFLQAALRRVAAVRPFRGPRNFSEGAFFYADEGEGNLDRFQGIERIAYRDYPVYELRYIGGLLA